MDYREHRLSIGQCASLACLLEVTAPKVGNVHRGADFDDVLFTDFAVSSVAIGPAFDRAQEAGVGRTAHDAIQATRDLVATNTNLGMILLMAPLACVPRGNRLAPESVHSTLAALSPNDSRLVYEAIRLAKPGGTGQVKEMDIARDAPADLLAAMRDAAERDLVARQYVDDFRLVLEEAVPLLVDARKQGWLLTSAIIHTHLKILSRHPDSLIARKCGGETARQASTMAARVLEAGGPEDESFHEAAADFDFWLRADGHRRNPGTTADLIAAALFAALRDELIQPPFA